MPKDRGLSPTHEMYLKVLYRTRGRHHVSRVRDLAVGLGVNPGTVSTVLKRLEEMHLVDHEKYGVVALTPAGDNVARCIVRRFESIREVLIEVFGLDEETATRDACRMEHAVSPVTIQRMRALLHQVRSGDVAIPKTSGPTLEDTCAQCASEGRCQAVIDAGF
jgi:DtxR family Mn-dependent transcriptional regulator